MTSKKGTALAREKVEGRLVGGKFSELANYSDLFERAHDGIVLVDVRNHEVLETNAAFRELIKSDRPAEGTVFFALFPEADRKGLRAWLASPAAAFEFNSIDNRILEFSAARVWLADYCEVYQLLARDVTKERMKQNLLERQSLTDEMTGLSNFRAFRARLALEHERAVLKNQPYSVAFFDVDHFKHFNDKNGHPAGDETLRRLASVLRSVSSRSEFVARYGGEEFVVLLAGSSLEAGREFAERARAAIEAEAFPHGEKQPLGRVTASVGVAVYENGVAPEETLKRADEALYESKQGGRNRVTAYLSGKSALKFLLKKAG
jgi:diguanylate cyclase (GGDEF)-like protein